MGLSFFFLLLLGSELIDILFKWVCDSLNKSSNIKVVGSLLSFGLGPVILNLDGDLNEDFLEHPVLRIWTIENNDFVLIKEAGIVALSTSSTDGNQIQQSPTKASKPAGKYRTNK
jgi:hypothetical protein